MLLRESMPRWVCLGFMLVSGVAAAARPAPPTDDEVAELRRSYHDDKSIGSLLDWADAERERGNCKKADKLYRHAFYSDEITPRERYRAQIGYERCEDPNNPRRPEEQLRLPEKPPKKVVKKRKAPKKPKLIPQPDEQMWVDDHDPYLAWKIAGYTTAGLTAIVTGVKLYSENPNGDDFMLNSTTGMIGVGAALTGAFLWRGYSGISMAPAVSGSSGGASASVSF